MTQEPHLDSYLDALRGDLPSAADEARIKRHLIGAGIAVSMALATKAAAAGSATVAKAGLITNLALRFAHLPLLSQFGLVVATTTAVATGPVLVAMRLHESAPATQAVQVGASQVARKPVMLHAPQSAARAAAREERAVVAPPLAPAQGSSSMLGTSKAASRLDAVVPGQDLTEASALAEETRLIDAALFAIRRGELGTATQLLDEHRMRFPQARLAREQQRARHKLDEARNGQRP